MKKPARGGLLVCVRYGPAYWPTSIRDPTRSPPPSSERPDLPSHVRVSTRPPFALKLIFSRIVLRQWISTDTSGCGTLKANTVMRELSALV